MLSQNNLVFFANDVLQHGEIIKSPGGCYKYKIIGAVCVLFDRECLPYPCCSLQWKGKQPSWRRVGRRFIPDIACKQVASYNAYLLGDNELPIDEKVITIFWVKLSPEVANWWYSKSKINQHTTPTFEQ